MEAYLDRLESQFSEFVTRISHFESIADFPAKFETLDRELVAEVVELRKHYNACRRIEALKQEGGVLDQKVNGILIELARFREELESSPSAPLLGENMAVNTQDLLDYSSKITRFTRQLPGSAEAGILPWPAEDQLRRGMLATLTIQEDSGPSEESAAISEHAHESSAAASMEPHATPAPERASEALTTETLAAASAGGERPPSKPTKPKPKPKISLDLDSDED